MSTLAEQVVEQLKTDMDNVYDAGYQKGLKEIGGLDVSKFGIQNEVKGTGLVTLDYVNKNEHNVEVKLSSDTVTDFSGCEVKCVGSNVYKGEDIVCNGNYQRINISLEIGTYTFSAIVESTDTNSTRCLVGNFGEINRGNGERTSITKTFTSAITRIDLYPSDTQVNSVGDIATFKDIQIEKLDHASEYRPYTEKTYTANADGTVDGVTSISPIMNIICEGVDITAKYYCCPTVEWHTFWDVYQEFGNRINYKNAFWYFWNDDNFKPKYDIVPKGAENLIVYTNITDLKALLEEQGVVLDMSQATTCCCAFEGNKAWTSFPSIDISSCTNFQWAFGYNYNLETIEGIENIQPTCIWGQAFQNCSGLKNIKLTGSVGTSISFGHSQYLTDESIQNIIDVLMDKTGQTATVLTLHNNVRAKLTEEQIATITSKNWTLA